MIKTEITLTSGTVRSQQHWFYISILCHCYSTAYKVGKQNVMKSTGILWFHL